MNYDESERKVRLDLMMTSCEKKALVSLDFSEMTFYWTLKNESSD